MFAFGGADSSIKSQLMLVMLPLGARLLRTVASDARDACCGCPTLEGHNASDALLVWGARLLKDKMFAFGGARLLKEVAADAHDARFGGPTP